MSICDGVEITEKEL